MRVVGQIESALILTEDLPFDGPVEALKDKLNAKHDRGFSLEWASATTFIFRAYRSSGTAMGNVGVFKGIVGHGSIGADEGQTVLRVKTKLRPELYLITLAVFVLAVVPIFTGDRPPMWLYLIWLVVPIWFWWVYRTQEKMLIGRIKKHVEG